jgi:hypothetical protein
MSGSVDSLRQRVQAIMLELHCPAATESCRSTRH